MRNRVFWRLLAAPLTLLLSVSGSIALGAQFVVDNSSDADDALPGDGVCSIVAGTSPGPCTLRAAIEEANALPGADTIVFNVPTTDNSYNPQTGAYTLMWGRQPPDITDALTITNSDPQKIIITRPPNGLEYHLFNVTAAGTVNLIGLTITRGAVSHLSSNAGGGVQNAGTGTVNITNAVFDTNFAITGGAFCNSAGGTAHFSQVIFKNNNANSGGAVANTGNGTVTIDNCTFDPNTAQNGAGVANTGSGGTVTITASALTHNTAQVSGAAIYSAGGTLNVTGGNISSNTATTGPSLAPLFGGGVYIGGGNAAFVSTTISGNKITVTPPPQQPSPPPFVGAGAGIANNGATVAITNCTISGNTITAPYNQSSGSPGAVAGGGIYSAGTLNLSNTTITGNSVTSGTGSGTGPEASGGGVFVSPSVVANVKSTLIAANSATTKGPDVFGTVASQGFNLVGKVDGSSGVNAPTDLLGTVANPLDPKLDPKGLQNNGGPTLTIALLAGSPAIDHGTSNSLTGNLTLDQRGSGFPRVLDDPGVSNANDGADIGAFELQVASSTPTPTPTPTPTVAPVSRLGNIATRLRVETGDNVLIGGFIVTGTQPKRVVIRGIGPSLAQFVSGYLTDPILELHDGSGQLLETNDNWIDSPNKQAIIDSGLAPTDNLESAIIRTLPASGAGYTAVVHGVNDVTGIAVVQIYDVDGSSDSKLANVSSRGFVQTADNVLFAGMIVVGQNSEEVVVRAIGPSLPVSGSLADPTLELHDGNGALLEFNDNWGDSANKQAIINSGLAPTNNAESAIMRSLSPANYTAIVRGANNGIGIAVVESYALN
jgi:hypothetical protein